MPQLIGRAIAFGALLAAIAASGAAAQELKPWRHAVVDPKGDAGFSVMVGKGDFGRNQGLKIEIVPTKNGIVAHKALLSGEVDSIEASPGATIVAGARGADVKIVGCDWPVLTHGLMVRSPIGKVEDLRGKTVAVAVPGSLPNVVLNAILDKYKVPRADVKQAPLGGDPDRFKALIAGVVDAGIVVREFLPLAPPNIKMLLDGRVALPHYIRNCISLRGKTIAERPDEAARFVAAEMSALHYALANRDATVTLTRETIGAKADDPRPAFVYEDTVKNKLLDPTLALPLESLKWMQDISVESGAIPKPIDLKTVTDGGVRAKALQRLTH